LRQPIENSFVAQFLQFRSSTQRLGLSLDGLHILAHLNRHQGGLEHLKSSGLILSILQVELLG